MRIWKRISRLIGFGTDKAAAPTPASLKTKKKTKKKSAFVEHVRRWEAAHPKLTFTAAVKILSTETNSDRTDEARKVVGTEVANYLICRRVTRDPYHALYPGDDAGKYERVLRAAAVTDWETWAVAVENGSIVAVPKEITDILAVVCAQRLGLERPVPLATKQLASIEGHQPIHLIQDRTSFTIYPQAILCGDFYELERSPYTDRSDPSTPRGRVHVSTARQSEWWPVDGWNKMPPPPTVSEDGGIDTFALRPRLFR